MGSIYVICSRQCPNGDGIYTLLYALYKYSTSITNQPTNQIVKFQFHPHIVFNSNSNTVEPLWKGWESLTKVAKFGPFPRTILYKTCLFYPLMKATTFDRPPSRVAFI